jgi:hypothetical protein
MLSTLAHKAWLCIAITVGVLLAAFVALTPANAASPMKAETVSKIVLKCDAKALDANHGDDCIQHKFIGDAAVGKTQGGNLSKLKVIVAPELRGRTLFGEIQFLSVDAHGVKSKWWTHRTIAWHAKHTVRAALKSFDACAPVKAGKYEVRIQASVPVSKEKVNAALTIAKTTRSRAFDTATSGATPSATPSATSSAAPTTAANPNGAAPNTSSSSSPTAAASASPSSSASTNSSPTSNALATSAISPMTVTQSSQSGSCAIPPSDQNIIDYFNAISPSGEFYLFFKDKGTADEVNIVCPQTDPADDYPGPDFELTLFMKDRSMSTNCNSSQPIVINKTNLKAKKYASCPNGVYCNFTVVLSNASTGSVFSSTDENIAVITGDIEIRLTDLHRAAEPNCAS